MINGAAINTAAINTAAINSTNIADLLPDPIFILTAPTTEPVSVTFSGANAITTTDTAAENLYASHGPHASVVIDITMPQTPTAGSY